jgi:transcription-repair coupling factor (superfamily II helicase)
MPAAAAAARVLERFRDGTGDLLFVAASERRADEAARALQTMADDPSVLILLPPWDCLPYDRAPPSRDCMGRRMAALGALATTSGRRLIVTSPEAAIQKTPPPEAARDLFVIRVGDALDRGRLQAFAEAAGYLPDDRIDEPGEIAFLGEVIDVFPASGGVPVRIRLSETEEVVDIHRFDPVTQRSMDGVAEATLSPACEWSATAAAAASADVCVLETHGERLTDVFSLAEAADLVFEDGVKDRLRTLRRRIAEAWETRRSFGPVEGPVPEPGRLYLAAEVLDRQASRAALLDLADLDRAPDLSRSGSVATDLRRLLDAEAAEGRKVIIAGLPHELRLIARRLGRAGGRALTPGPWAEADVAEGPVAAVHADLDGGYRDHARGRLVLTPTDILGGRIARPGSSAGRPFEEPDLRLGDVVVHEDHGLGVLRGLEQLEIDGVQRDVVRLEYQGGATVLAGVEEFGRIWRYGSEPSAVTLDRLKGAAWPKRRAEASAQVDAAAARLVHAAQARLAERTDPVTPPDEAYADFVGGFAFPESPDQQAAITAVLDDLASGRPMNRLVCGDVGFGKTEVALRAAAAVALSGRQVMLAAPTTLLARQHFDTFRRRFDGLGVKVAQLSRLTDATEAETVVKGLEDGSIKVVVGTQALARPDLAFADLALVMIDEEHRFGAAVKADLSARAPHRMSFSATPIPRTLQSALVGVQDVSLIASPPARRRPIRTFVTAFDPGALRTVLLREHARGGQSFVVAPRIQDLAPLEAVLAQIVPELEVIQAHGRLAPETLDAALADFADGRGDLLLATNIVENGLDVPRANTMVVCGPERFGLAQLHQLRGRVGRGRRQGFAYLLCDPDLEPQEATRLRLQTIEALDRLGAGFAISARDLDLRGGGDLVGEEQAGHIRLIGAGLYQEVMARALRAARGEAAPERPTLNLGQDGLLPADYVPDAAMRVNLYARLARLTSAADIDELQEEVEDRFGPLPDAAEALFHTHRLSALAGAAGVTALVAGPRATALSFAPARRVALQGRPLPEDTHWSDDRLIVETSGTAHDAVFLERLLADLG